MVVPNRELVNKSLFNSPTYTIPFQNTNLPTVELFNNTGIDIFKGWTPNNYDEVRGRKPSQSSISSRDASMVSSTSFISYHEKIERNNRIDIDDNNNFSSELFYETLQEKEIYLGKATETQTNTRLPHNNLIVNTLSQHDSGNHPTSTPP